MSAPAEPRIVRPWHAAGGIAAAAVLGHGCGCVAGVAVVLIMMVTTGGSAAALTPESLVSFPLLAASGLTTQVMLVVCAVGVPLLARANVPESLGLRRAPVLCFVLAVIGVIALGPLSDAIVSFMREHFPGLTFGTLSTLDDVLMRSPVWGAWPVIALSPGIGEELVFRGMFQRAIRRPVLAVTLSAVIFAAFHLDPHQVLGTLPAGFFLAWLAYRTGSTFVPILGHITNNTVALVALKNDQLRAFEFPWWGVFAGIGVVMLVLLALEVVRPRAPVVAAPAPA